MRFKIVFLTLTLWSMSMYSMDVSNRADEGLSLEEVKSFGEIFRTLACLNKDLNLKFGNEDSRKTIMLRIMEMEKDYRKDTDALSCDLKFTQITKKIDDLFEIAEDENKEFAQDQLNDSFYLNLYHNEKSLLRVVAECSNINKMKQILSSKKIKEDCIYQRALALTRTRHRITTPECSSKLLEKLVLLLGHIKNVDYRLAVNQHTLLMRAIINKDEIAVQLLLLRGANPYLCYIPVNEWIEKIDSQSVLNAEEKEQALNVFQNFQNNKKSYENRLQKIKKDNFLMPEILDAFDQANNCKDKKAGWFKELVKSVQAKKDIFNFLLCINVRAASGDENAS